MNKTIVLGHAHPYHENSYSWVVDAFDDAETAQKLVQDLNSIDTKWYPKWRANPRPTFVRPYAWFTQEALDECLALHPRSVPPEANVREIGSDVSLQFTCYTIGDDWSDEESDEE